MRRVILAAFALTVLAACQPAPTELTEEQKAAIADTIRQLDEVVNRAYDARDLEAFLSHFVDGPAYVNVNQGVLQDRAGVRERLESDFTEYPSNTTEVTDRRIFVLGPNAVVCTVLTTYTQTNTDGESSEGTSAYTSMWTRSNGEWQVVHEHASQLPAEAT